jgi:hypothetical protein
MPLQGNEKRRDLLAACEVCGPQTAILAFGLPEGSKLNMVENVWKKTLFSRNGVDVLKRLDCIMNKKTNDCQDCIKKYYYVFWLFLILAINGFVLLSVLVS